ncbi:MAG TPA: hypothetical protein VF796_22775 [Humisphaera sp.]
MRKLYPMAEPDAEAVDGWHGSLSGPWAARFDDQRRASVPPAGAAVREVRPRD